MIPKVYLGLGSNLGDRQAALERATERLSGLGIHILRQSSIWETEPQDLPGQPWFLNLVIEAETSLMPRQLLKRVQRVENSFGRKRSVSKGPRVIDIDILLYGDVVMLTPELEIPHPRMVVRRFVLEPLAELAPELRHPRTGRTVEEMLVEVRDQGARKLG